MARHRNLKYIISEEQEAANASWDQESDGEQQLQEEEKLGIEEQQILNQLKKIVGSKISEEKILQALEKTGWDIELAKNILQPNKNPKPIKKVLENSGQEPQKPKVQQLNVQYPELQIQELSPRMPNLNLVVIGHVDAGKSTLMGHLLYQLNYVSEKTMHKFKKEAEVMGKQSFIYAWVLDQDEEERARGVTIDVGYMQFTNRSGNKNFTLLDSPGHRDFVPRMIAGTSQADVALLVISAKTNEFEAGFEKNVKESENKNSEWQIEKQKYSGQTREHVMLARALGIMQLIVVVNKMDEVNWSEERYNEIQQKLTPFIKQKAGFQTLTYIPVSGLKGENLTEKFQQAEWYQGPCLLDLLDSIPISLNVKLIHKPSRFIVADNFKPSYGGGHVFSGKVEGGVIKLGQKVLIQPIADAYGIVKQISKSNDPNQESEKLQKAVAGEAVDLTLNVTPPQVMETTQLQSGIVLCCPEWPIPFVNRFLCKVITFDLLTPVTWGYECVLHVQTTAVECKITKILEQYNQSEQVIKNKPRFLTSENKALIEVFVESSICLENHGTYRSLGRVAFREGGRTLMAGLVKELLS